MLILLCKRLKLIRMASMTNFRTLNLLLVMCFFVIATSDILDYSSLETMGVSCYPMDSCGRRGQLSFTNRSCECDPMCTNYNDCCIDALQPSRNTLRTIPGLKCLTYDSEFDGVYAVSKCKRNWRGPAEVRVQCENVDDLSDPFAAAPATDISNDITYKNRYCALCNNARADTLRSWQVSIECNVIPDNTSTPLVDPEYVESHLTYVTSGTYINNWGFYHAEDDRETPEDGHFYPCAIPFRLPDTLESHVRHCRPHLVSDCATTWRRNVVREQCKAYTAVVYIDSEVYKNPHCAICNLKNLEFLSCNIPEITGRRKKPALSFSLLLDVNLSDGNQVGVVRNSRCPSGQKWDPFFKKCRTLVCAIPGYKLQNGRCVRP